MGVKCGCSLSLTADRVTSYPIFLFRLTGFQLFLQTKRSNAEEDDNELEDGEIIQKYLEEWKGLSAAEKKEWNTTAKEGIDDEDVTNIGKTSQKEKVVNGEKLGKSKDSQTINGISKSKGNKVDTSNSKSKLAGFAFQKK